MDVRDIVLTANTPARQAIPHRFFMLIEAASPVELRKLSVGSLSYSGERGRSVEAGYKYFPLDATDPRERWGGFELESTVTQTVRVGVSDSAGDYARLVQLFEQELADGLDDVADVTVSNTAVQLLPSNANRTKAIITNSSAEPMRVGKQATVATNRGVRVDGGQSITLHTKAAIYAIREGAADATANITFEYFT